MGRRSGLLFGAVFALVVAVSSASQVSFEGKELLQRRILLDLKQAKEAAGIFVEDEDLFLNPQVNSGRKLLQAAELAQILANPTVMAALVGLMSNGSTVGGFPGTSMSLPGGSPFGYSPTNNSYCLFSTQPAAQAPAATISTAGAPATLPGAFTCVEGTVAAPGGFVVSYDGTSYACVSAAGAPAGRKLLQSAATSPAIATMLSQESIGNFFENILNAVGLPIWNCVTATTPAGNTTVGETAMAVLNDLGVVAEHFLNYLNGDGELSYAQNIQNNFVSLTNPLYPTGPRLNFSIDFAAVAKDQAIFQEIFGFPLPPSPPPPAPVATVAASLSSPATPTTGGTVPSGSTPTTTSSTSGSSSSSNTSTSTSTGSSAGVTSQTSTSATSPPAPVTATTPPTPPPAMANLTAFDGYLSNCQVVLGSAPGLDGNFQRVAGYQAVILNGQTTMTMNATSTYAGSIAYVIPSSKSVAYPTLTATTASTAQFCYDIATLLPVYNPLATVVTPNATGMSANAISTVAVFGEALGVTASQVAASLGLTQTGIFTYDAIAQASAGDASALNFLQVNAAVNNLVTSGANLLTNDSTVYATYAIIMNQAIAQKILYSPASNVSQTTGRRLLQTTASGPPAVDLTNATTVNSILALAQQLAYSTSNAAAIGAMTPNLSSAQVAVVAQAVANLNNATISANSLNSTQLSAAYADQYLADEVADLATGVITTDNFNNATSQTAITAALNSTLPGSILPVTPASATVPAPATSSTLPQTQSSESTTSKKSGGGLSHGGKVALATVLPIAGVAAIAGIVVFVISRRNRQSETSSSNVWYRRPFARSQGSAV